MPALPTDPSTLSIAGRVVVFDYGEVISRSPSSADQDELFLLTGIAEEHRERFWQSYWTNRPPLDQGTVLPTDYWRAVGDELGRTWTASERHALWVVDFRSWWSVEPATLDLIERLHLGGTRIALLSNAGFDFASGFRFSPMAAFFERMFVSAEMDAIKPDPAIYREVAAELGIALEQMVFVDNKLENVDAATALGITAHHFTTPALLEQFLVGLATR